MHRLYMLALPPVLLLACFGTCVWAEGPIPEEGFKDLLASPAETWRGYHKPGWPEGWKLEDGVLHRLGGGDDLMTKKDFADFDLRLEWKIAEGGNSGIIYRASDGQDAPYWTGPEYQLLDDQKHHDGKNTLTSTGSLYAVYAPSEPAAKPVGQWNQTRIVVVGNHVEHWLNGKKVVEAEIGSDDWSQRVAESKFKDKKRYGKNRKGYIDLQDHGDDVWFRNVRIKDLAPTEE